MVACLALTPDRGSYLPGQSVRFTVTPAASLPAGAATARLTIHHLDRPQVTLEQPWPAAGPRYFDWKPPPEAPRGYGARVDLLDAAGARLARAFTACDVLPHWTTFPRYGFLTDFSPGRPDVAQTLAALLPYHLNALQLYDWQYRHDQLLPPQKEYTDPLGRPLSLATVAAFIEQAGALGMACLPYLAIYAASLAFWRDHSAWALYDEAGQPHAFHDFLGLMDPSPGRPWSQHLLDQCRQVLDRLPVAGLHVDQYGQPRQAYDSQGQAVDLPAAFAAFIRALKDAHPQAAVLFNAVANWPIETLAAAPVDFDYIEIWPPEVRLRDIWRIVANARALSGRRPVVVACYLPAAHAHTIRLTGALIFCLGGSRIELGERARLLADPYFPKHQPLPAALAAAIRRQYDFAVRYGELIGPGAAGAPEVDASAPAGVWAIPRRAPGWLTLCLLNVSGLAEPRWDEDLPRPPLLAGVSIRVPAPAPGRAWWASPDGDDPALRPLPFQVDGQHVTFTLPALDTWAMVALEYLTS